MHTLLWTPSQSRPIHSEQWIPPASWDSIALLHIVESFQLPLHKYPHTLSGLLSVAFFWWQWGWFCFVVLGFFFIVGLWFVFFFFLSYHSRWWSCLISSVINEKLLKSKQSSGERGHMSSGVLSKPAYSMNHNKGFFWVTEGNYGLKTIASTFQTYSALKCTIRSLWSMFLMYT